MEVCLCYSRLSESDPANDRLISLNSVACKLCRVCCKDYLLEHGVINRNQRGFLSRKSSTTQLFECCFDWNIALNKHSKLDIIYLDYAKAFDSVVHSKLLAKLDCYGVDSMLLAWIRNFLTGHTQFVNIPGACSTACFVVSGVP